MQQKPNNTNMDKKEENSKGLTLKALNKSSVWDLQENDIFRLWESADKDADVLENPRHYQDIIRSAFMIEEIKDDSKAVKEKYEKNGYKVAQVKLSENVKVTWALKKKPIVRVTDLTYENIRHISAAKLVEVLDRNFGGGWDSISLAIRDIIETGFEISTTQLPQSRIHIPGGTLDKKVAQGFEVLEIPKGTWVEAIFAKKKDPVEKIHMEMPDREYDEDGNLIPLPDDMNDKDDLDADEALDNDDTYFSSLTPEAEMSDLAAEGLAIEDVGEGEEEE